VAVVCDGCGSGEHSEVGAWITAEIAVKQTLLNILREQALFRPETAHMGLDKVRRSVLAQLGVLADMAGSSLSRAVSTYLLSTILGVILTEEDTLIFGAADGIFFVNGSRNDILKDNQPPYLAYNLTDSGQKPALDFHYYMRTRDVNSVLLGTDGAVALADAADKKIPGKDERVGPICQFWQQDRYFKNAFAIGHRLNLVNRDSLAVDYEAKAVREEYGPLTDDTTIFVLRRK
jgi:hypothetical protein